MPDHSSTIISDSDHAPNNAYFDMLQLPLPSQHLPRSRSHSHDALDSITAATTLEEFAATIPSHHNSPYASNSPNPSKSVSPAPSTGSGSDDGSTKTSSTAKGKSTTPQPGRRGHFKSRFGCYNCKRRRVKCSEERPKCASCRRFGLQCEYPVRTDGTPNTPTVSGTQAALASANAQGLGGGGLTLQDLQYYHQFLTVAYPTLPIRGQSLWFDAAAMSFQYQHLAHAVLALGASYLTMSGVGDHGEAALRHRVLAMKLASEQLTHFGSSGSGLGLGLGQSYQATRQASATLPSQQQIPGQQFGPDGTPIRDGDALFATLVILNAQAGLMPDAMTEYLTLVRGVEMVGRTVLPGIDHDASIFATWSHDGHGDGIPPDQPLDHELIAGFRRSAMMLQGLCQTAYEAEYVALLLNVVAVLEASSTNAWMSYTSLFAFPTHLSNDDFLAFVNPQNHVAQLMIAHMFLLDYMLGQLSIRGSMEETRFGARRFVVLTWVYRILEALPVELRPYGAWIREYADTIRARDQGYLYGMG